MSIAIGSSTSFLEARLGYMYIMSVVTVQVCIIGIRHSGNVHSLKIMSTDACQQDHRSLGTESGYE